MGEGFSNFVANASGMLVRTVLKSANYVAGSLGWQIGKDGSAEFNNATIRGSLAIGTSPNPRVFFGSNIPATLANFSADFTWQVAVLWYYNATDYYWEAIGTFVGGGGPFPVRGRGTYSTLTPGSGIVIFEFNQRQVTLSNVLYGSTSYSAQPVSWVFRNGSVVFQSDTALDLASGSQTIANVVGYAIDCQINSIPETFTSAVYTAAGWSGKISYRQVIAPPRSVQLSSTGVGLGTKVDGTKIFNIPAPYRPAVSQDVPVSINTMAGATAQSPHLNIGTNGDVTIWGCASATNFGINAIYPLESP